MRGRASYSFTKQRCSEVGHECDQAFGFLDILVCDASTPDDPSVFKDPPLLGEQVR